MNPQDITQNVMSQAVMATTIVKLLVDLIKLCWGGDQESQPPNWVPPVGAIVIGITVMVLLGIASSQDLTKGPPLASAILAGLMAATSAVGVTTLHTMARSVSPSPSVSPLVPAGGLQSPPSQGLTDVPGMNPYSQSVTMGTPLGGVHGWRG